MTKDQLLQELSRLKDLKDNEAAHLHADFALIDYIGDLEIKIAYGMIKKRYS